jgi:hypothetical protein
VLSNSSYALQLFTVVCHKHSDELLCDWFIASVKSYDDLISFFLEESMACLTILLLSTYAVHLLVKKN